MSSTFLIATKGTGRTAHPLTRFALAFYHLIERQRAVTALSRLSDHQLRDIGISRAEIDHAVDYGRFR